MDRFPLPNIEEMVSTLEGACYFSTLDLASAYHQVPLSESSQDLTVFITPMGAYKFLRMLFGLVSAASVFQRIMNDVIKGIPGVRCYQDDVLIFGKNIKEHDCRVTKVLGRLLKAGLTLRRDKCKFGVTEVDYLGHHISGSGVPPKKELVDTIENLREPGSKEELASFLGMAEYYSKFIRNFADKTEQLRSLLHRNAEFVWDESV